MGQARPIAHEPQHGADARIIFAQARLRRGGRGEERPAQSAAQPFQFKDVAWKSGWAPMRTSRAGRLEQVEFGLEALGTEVSRLELGMRHLHPLGPRIILGGLAAMAFALWALAWRRPVATGIGRRSVGKELLVFSVLAPKISRWSRPRVVFLASMSPMTHCRVRNSVSTN